MRVLAAAVCLLGPVGGAQAAFRVCNDSFDVLNIALARDSGQAGFRSEGWWTVAPNRCAILIRGPIDARYLYLHIIDVFNQPVLDGQAQFCVAENRFSIVGEYDCWARGHIEAGFAEVDTGQAEDWTLFITETQELR